MISQRMQILSLTLAAMSVAMLFATSACAQSSTRGDTGAAADDLQLAGPEKPMKSSPAPAAEIEVPPIDDAITKGAPDTPSVDDFLANKAQPIPDADRQPALPTNLDPAESTEPPKSDDATGALAARVERLEKLIEAQSATLEEMRLAQASMLPTEELKKIREEIVALRNSFQTVARPDLGGGASNTQPTQPPRGMLVVENLTGLVYTMNINGYDFPIYPGQRQFNVPIGPVVTELRGYEAPRSWTAENFRQVGDGQQLAIQIQ